jgi:hypothetical protein
MDQPQILFRLRIATSVWVLPLPFLHRITALFDVSLSVAFSTGRVPVRAIIEQMISTAAPAGSERRIEFLGSLPI